MREREGRRFVWRHGRNRPRRVQAVRVGMATDSRAQVKQLASHERCEQVFMAVCLLAIILGFFAVILPGGMPDTPGIGETLSDSQVARLEEEIEALPDDGVREVVRRWRPARQVAELFCRPVALPELVRLRYTSEAPLFFELGPDDQLKLENGQKLTGRGQLRGDGRWHPFRFECDLDTRTGGVAGFRVEFTS